MDTAIGKLAEKARADKIELIGYSGGGAVAVLVAARRNDISGIRTVAGNLDHGALSRYHNVTRLYGSLDPIDYAGAVRNISQRHFVGGKDEVIHISFAEGFLSASGDHDHTRLTVMKECSHEKGWVKHWPELLKKPLV